MMRQFRSKTQALFKIVATVMIDEDQNEKTSNFLYTRLLAKFTKQSKKKILNSDEQSGKTVFNKEFTSEGLANQFNGFVWNKACQKMGRPEKSLVDYQQESTDKIAAWELQLQNIEDGATKEKTQVRNKIAALRSRMNAKANKGESLSKDMAGFQSNFKEFIKILSCTKCHNAVPLRRIILSEIEKINPSHIEKEPQNVSKHWYINRLEKFVWSLDY